MVAPSISIAPSPDALTSASIRTGPALAVSVTPVAPVTEPLISIPVAAASVFTNVTAPPALIEPSTIIVPRIAVFTVVAPLVTNAPLKVTSSASSMVKAWISASFNVMSPVLAPASALRVRLCAPARSPRLIAVPAARLASILTSAVRVVRPTPVVLISTQSMLPFSSAASAFISIASNAVPVPRAWQ